MSTTRGIDFSALALRDALDLAVLIEEEARDRYEEFADQMQLHASPEAERFFRFMAINEEKHRAQLHARRTQLFADEPTKVSRTMIFDVEAPEYDEAHAFMTTNNALESALRSETKAFEFFSSALEHVQDSQVRALFEELRDEELDHQELIRREMAKTPPDPELKAIDFADDPVGH
jgi:rubrerythrin